MPFDYRNRVGQTQQYVNGSPVDSNGMVWTTSGPRAPQVAFGQRAAPYGSVYGPPGSRRAGGGSVAPQQTQSNPMLDAINGMVGGGGYQTGYGGSANINTSIQPQNIYSPQQSQEAVNQAMAENSVPLPWMQNRMTGGGMSVNSPGVMSRALVPYAQGISAGQTAAAQIPFQDMQANAQHFTTGERAREGEAIDWARLLSGANSANNSFRMNTLTSLLGMLGQFA